MRFLKKLLNEATEEELKGLADILKVKNATTDSIIASISRNAQNTFINIIKPKTSYKEIVCKVADKLKINYKKYHSTKQIEIKIAQKVIETALEKMTPEQRKKMEEELRKTAQKFDKTGTVVTSTSVFGILTAAQLSGFGVYLLASTALGFITNAMSFTFPFVIYTTMSQTIALIIGPAGWIGTGLFTIWKLTGPSYKKLIPAIIYIGSLRYEHQL